jgi:uncharacterized membrane protein
MREREDPMAVRHVTTHADRGAAFLVYVIMFISPFMVGAPMLLASSIAMARRGSADPVSASHFNYQLSTMGKDVLLEAIGAVCLWLAAFGGLATLAGEAPIHVMPQSFNPMNMGLISLGLLLTWLLCWAWAALSLFLTPAFGALRLASGKPAMRRRI